MVHHHQGHRGAASLSFAASLQRVSQQQPRRPLEIVVVKAKRSQMAALLSDALPGRAYVGRPSALGNPFPLGAAGSRSEVIASYKGWLWKQMQTPGPVEDALLALLQQGRAGRLELVCWCAPLACHADVIRAALLWLHAQGAGKSQ